MKKQKAVGSFTELYEHTVAGNELLGVFLPGHLAIEFLLRRLVSQYDPNLKRLADDLNHAKLILLNHEIGTIDAGQREVLLAINGFRNKLAHQLTFQPALDDLRKLWEKAGVAFSDLTDGITQGSEALGKAKSLTDLDGWEFGELFVQICYDLHIEYVQRGGGEDVF